MVAGSILPPHPRFLSAVEWKHPRGATINGITGEDGEKDGEKANRGVGNRKARSQLGHPIRQQPGWAQGCPNV
jgi:hypothetical protein